MAVDLNADYDEGYFDKDEQGWCSHRVTITSDGERVTIRRSGDDNGARPYDETVEGRVGLAWPELGLIQILCRQESPYFDTRTRRLRSASEQVDLRFTPPASYRDAGSLAAVAQIVAEVAAALGLVTGRPPPDPLLPAPSPDPHVGGALVARLELVDERGCNWELLVRDDPAGEFGPQLSVRVQGPGVFVSLFVHEPGRASFLFVGPLERHHLAAAARDRRLAAWCGAAA